MSPFRVLQISIMVLVLFGSAWLVRIVGSVASPTDEGASTWLSGPAALADVLQQGDNGDNGGDNGGDNDDGDNSGNSNNSNSNSNNSNGNGNDDFDDNDNFELPPYPR